MTNRISLAFLATIDEIMPERMSFKFPVLFQISIVRTVNGKYLNAFLHGD